MYLKRIMKILVVALVICVLMFSVVSASASFDPPIYTFLTLDPIIGTIPPMVTFFTFSFGPFFTPEPSDTSDIVNFSDNNLRDALMMELGVASNELTENYLESITGTLDLSGWDISALKGIEHLTNLQGLILRDNKLSEKNQIRYLRFLTSLEYLDISALSTDVLPSELSQLTNLKYLDISANRLTSLPSSFKDFNLDVLKCNYCYFDITDSSFTNILIEATDFADYQYQLAPIDFYLICQTAGTVEAKWDEMPDIHFPNGAIAEVARYSFTVPNASGKQGNWMDSESRETTSFTYDGLDSGTTYAFSISCDYYIRNTIYDGKYIKLYTKNFFQPVPQDTPTPTPTMTPTPTPTPTVTTEPATATPEVTSAPADMVVIGATDVANAQQNQNGSDDTFLTVLLVLVIVLIVAIVGLVVVMFIRMNNPPPPSGGQEPPKE